MTIVTVGIDLAKNVFAVHGVDATGKPVLLRPSVPRAKLAVRYAALLPSRLPTKAAQRQTSSRKLLPNVANRCITRL